MQNRSKLAAMIASRKPASQDEIDKANIEAAESDFKDTDEEKKTISVRDIDPDAEKKFRVHIFRQQAIKAKKEYDKKRYEEMMKLRGN